MTKRYDSLDVLRGLTVTFMCMVNNPGTWSHMYAPMKHAAWVGCTPTDLIYPFFLFCSGCAMAFSYSKFDSFNRQAMWKLTKRSLGIFAIGLLLNLYPFFPVEVHDTTWTFGQNYAYWLSQKRIMGVLQRIAMAYFIAGVLALWLRKPGKIIAAIAVLCVAYTGILVVFGSDPGPFTLEGTISRKIDVALLGESHVYHGYRFEDGTRAAFDPEGPLGSMTAACTCLLGYLIGSLIIGSSRRFADNPQSETDQPTFMICRIFCYGLLSLALAEVLSIWIPISKPLWSASYVFFSAGWAMVMLAFFSFCIDVCSIRKPFKVFKIMGMNAMAAFVLSGVIAKSYSFVGWSSAKYFGANEFMSLVYSCIFATVIFAILFVLYKKKIFIKL